MQKIAIKNEQIDWKYKQPDEMHYPPTNTDQKLSYRKLRPIFPKERNIRFLQTFFSNYCRQNQQLKYCMCLLDGVLKKQDLKTAFGEIFSLTICSAMRSLTSLLFHERKITAPEISLPAIVTHSRLKPYH